jgi:hypothetical protein
MVLRFILQSQCFCDLDLSSRKNENTKTDIMALSKQRKSGIYAALLATLCKSGFIK